MFREKENSVFNYKDIAVFESVFKEWLPDLILFSRKITSDEFASEDIVLSTFTKVWEGNESFRNKAHLRSYIYSSVRNSSINYLRNNRDIKSIEDLNEGTISIDHLVDNSFIESQVRSMLFKSVEELPDKCKEIFKLNVLEGVTLKEISEELNVSENTVKTHKTRALKILREKLSPKIYSLFVAMYRSSIVDIEVEEFSN